MWSHDVVGGALNERRGQTAAREPAAGIPIRKTPTSLTDVSLNTTGRFCNFVILLYRTLRKK